MDAGEGPAEVEGEAGEHDDVPGVHNVLITTEEELATSDAVYQDVPLSSS
jgi:hypothetical protein